MRLDASQALLACPRMARATSVPKSGTPANLYSCDTLLERLAQDLQNMAAELGPFIQKENAVVRQRHVARHRHVAPAGQPRIRDGMMGRATRAGRDQRCAVVGAAGDTVNAWGLNGFGQRYRRQDGGESVCLDHACLTHPFPLVRAWQACARGNAPTRSRALRPSTTRQTRWIQPHHRSADPWMALMTSSTLASQLEHPPRHPPNQLAAR